MAEAPPTDEAAEEVEQEAGEAGGEDTTTTETTLATTVGVKATGAWELRVVRRTHPRGATGVLSL